MSGVAQDPPEPWAQPIAVAIQGQLFLSGGKSLAADKLAEMNVCHCIAFGQNLPALSCPCVHIEAITTTHAEALVALHKGCDAIEALLQPCSQGSVLVHSSRGPDQGGFSGAVGAAFLLRHGHCASLAEALDRCCNAAKLKANSLAALCALELEVQGLGPSDLPAALATSWDIQSDVGDAEGRGSVAVARGAAMRLRQCSRDPLVCHVSDFVSAAEATHLISLAASRLEPSRVARSEAALDALLQVLGSERDEGATEAAGVVPKREESRAWRTSTSCSLGGGARETCTGREEEQGSQGEYSLFGDDCEPRGGDAEDGDEEDPAVDPVVQRVIERACYLSGLSPAHAEDVQVVQYTPGQEYREHTDYFSPFQDAKYDERTGTAGNRLVSVFCCLAQATRGGATVFPKLGLEFILQRGDALLWMNVERNGKLDGRTLHAGRPVEEGAKVGLNVWLRQRPIAAAGTESSGPATSPPTAAATATAAPAQHAGWKPLRPAPRLTAATPSAQLSRLRSELL